MLVYAPSRTPSPTPEPMRLLRARRAARFGPRNEKRDRECSRSLSTVLDSRVPRGPIPR